MSEPFHGVLPALVTPFTDDGSAIDPGAVAATVERLIGAGVAGLVPGGSTGEFTTLSHAERRELIETTVEAASGRVPVVAGTGALSTRETIELSVHAERAGAAAVMIVPPFYDALSRRELLAHYTAVADAIEIPIMYYNLPSASGVKLTAAQFRELLGAGVACLKDTGGDAVAATELIQTDGPTLLNGWDTLTFSALAAGVRAVVWGTASIVPERCVELHRLLIDDPDLPAARELWARLWPLCHFLESQSRATRQPSRRRAGSSATPQALSVHRCSRSTTSSPTSSPRCSNTQQSRGRRDERLPASTGMRARRWLGGRVGRRAGARPGIPLAASNRATRQPCRFLCGRP
jgi:dihydrodipicolinate synthase/N-acetylneuraminate lyase